MSAHIPQHINPIQMAKQGTSLTGVLLVKECIRLQAALCNHKGGIQVAMQFGVDELGHQFMRGTIDAALQVLCQRCLESMAIPIHAVFNFNLVKDEAAANQLPKPDEALIVAEKEISLVDIIEDEILLALPIVPMHVENECRVSLVEFNKQLKTTSSNEEETNIFFRKLKILKDKKH